MVCLHSVTAKLDPAIQDCLNQNENNFFDREIVYRASRVLVLGAAACATVADLALGILATLGVVFTLGQWKPCARFASREMMSSGEFLAISFKSLLHFMNPHARWDSYQPESVGSRILHACDKGNRANAESRFWADRNIKARIDGVECTAVAVVTGIFDMFKGAVAGALAFGTFGLSSKLNTYAVEHLEGGNALGMIPLGVQQAIRFPL